MIRCALLVRALLLCWALMWGPSPAHAAHVPRIAFVSIHVAVMPTVARKAAVEVSDRVHVDYFGLGEGLIPDIKGVDLGAYDLVLLDAAGPQLLNFTRQIEATKARTKVLVVGPGTPIAGNVDPALHPDVARYWANATSDNFAGLLLYAAGRVLGRAVAVPPPVEYPTLAFWHPDAPAAFETFDTYIKWQTTRLTDAVSRPKIGVIFYRSSVLSGDTALVAALAHEIEAAGGLPVPIWREGGRDDASVLLGATRLDALILCANRINYASQEAGVAQARRLGVPPLMCANDYRRNAQDWAQSHGGFAPASTGELAMAESDGIVEPMTVAARELASDGTASYRPIASQVRWRVARAMRWARLHRLPNAEKRIVISYHNEEPGEADIGSDPDSYLDAQGSMAALLHRLRAEGYDTGPAPLPDSARLARLLMEKGTNLEPGDAAALRRRIAQGAITVPLADYLRWYDRLPAALRASVEKVWGRPPGAVMTVDGQIVIPALHFGRIALVAHPMWGPQLGGDALTGKDALPPHHQYLAFYLWMQQQGHADAFLPLFTQLSLMPGKQEGPAADDTVSLLIGILPHIQPLPLQANGGVANKRRTQAVTIGFMPEFARAGLSPPLAALADLLKADRLDEAALRRGAAAANLAGVLGLDPASAPLDRLKPALARYLAETEHAPMTLGGHVIGKVPDAATTARMVNAMLSVDRTAPDPQALSRALAGDDGALDAETTRLARDYAARIVAAPHEMDAIIAALSGRYVEPGPMRDAIRNPDALPAGRNPYTLDLRAVPTPDAWQQGVQLADDMIAAYREKHGRIPRKVAFVLWSNETAQNGGTNEAQILHLLGVRPVWDARGHVVDVALVDRATLGRPRVDVLVTTSGTYRDHFAEKIALIAKAVRLVADRDEADNPVRAETLQRAAVLEAQGVPSAQARARALHRVFSTAPGAYSPLTEFAGRKGWSNEKLNRLYTDRIAHAYGDEGTEGAFDTAAFSANLDWVDAAVFARSSSAYGLLDTPMPAAYLGGLSLAVREATGRTIDTFVANGQDPGQPRMETLERFYGRERDSRYLNPSWIKAMQASGYNGARYMAGLVDSMALWERMRPDLVTDADWNAVRDVYLRDRYHLGMDRYFARENPAARRDMVRMMRDAIRRGDWDADAETRAQLSAMAGPSQAPVQQQGLAHQAAPGSGNVRPSADAGPPQVSGYELVSSARPRALSASDPVREADAWLAALALLTLLAGGTILRPRW